MIFTKKTSPYFRLGEECVCIKGYDSVKVGEVVKIMIISGTNKSIGATREVTFAGGQVAIDMVHCSRNTKKHFLPIRLMDDKEVFILRMTGKLPERFSDV